MPGRPRHQLLDAPARAWDTRCTSRIAAPSRSPSGPAPGEGGTRSTRRWGWGLEVASRDGARQLDQPIQRGGDGAPSQLRTARTVATPAARMATSHHRRRHQTTGQCHLRPTPRPATTRQLGQERVQIRRRRRLRRVAVSRPRSRWAAASAGGPPRALQLAHPLEVNPLIEAEAGSARSDRQRVGTSAPRLSSAARWCRHGNCTSARATAPVRRRPGAAGAARAASPRWRAPRRRAQRADADEPAPRRPGRTRRPGSPEAYRRALTGVAPRSGNLVTRFYASNTIGPVRPTCAGSPRPNRAIQSRMRRRSNLLPAARPSSVAAS
jgi:hypothetical protein